MGVGKGAGDQQAQIFLCREHRAGIIVCLGSHHHLGENAADGFGGWTVKWSVDGDDAAERRYAVACQCRLIGFDQGIGARYAARVGMLDDDYRWRAVTKFAHQFERRVRVVVIVVG